MKKLLLISILASFALTCFADLDGNGYYRVQNAYTKRYTYLLDNKGSFDQSTTSADVQALELYLGFVKASSDPSTVFYLSKANVAGSDAYYDIAGQGTSVYGFLKEYIKILKGKVYDGEQSYYAYAARSGVAKYLGDRRAEMDEEKGLASVEANKDARLWYIDPVDAKTSDSYFGISPTVTAAGKYYYPFFAAFPYAAYSEGLRFYYASYVDTQRGIVVLKEILGTVPAATPVIVECSHPLPVDNKLTVGPAGNPSPIASNLLNGVYFDNSSDLHYNRTKFDKKTMRVLGVNGGKLSFIEGSCEFIPRNQAYLQLSDDSQYEINNFTVMTQAEYEGQFGAVESISAESVVDVFGVDGMPVKQGVKRCEIDGLGKGVYIIRSKDRSEKILIP